MRRAKSVLAALLAMLACAPAAARASSSQQSILYDDGQLIYSSPRHVKQVLKTLASLGVQAVKVSMVWSLVAPDASDRNRPGFDAADPAAYPSGAWDRYDRLDRAAHRLGMQVYFQFTPPSPAWAIDRTLPGGQGSGIGRAPDPRDFSQFVQAVGTRYSGGYDGLPRVSEWGIWNEPNFPSWLNPWHRELRGGGRELTQPAIYRSLVDAAFTGLENSGHSPSADTLLIGETANFGNVNPIPFVEDLYCVGRGLGPLTGRAAAAVGCPRAGDRAAFVSAHPGLFEATGFAHHPYSFDVPPDRRYPAGTFVTLHNLGWLERVLNGIFSGYGQARAGGVPLYLTEFGYKTRPPNPYVRTTLTQQQAWLDEADYAAWRYPYVSALAQFLLVDSPPRAGERPGSRKYWSTFQTGLMFHWGKPKPSFFTYRLPVWLPDPRHGSAVAVWGQIRPAALTPAGSYHYAVVEFRAAGSPTWQQLTVAASADPNGFVQTQVALPSRGRLRLAWLDPGSDKLYYSRQVTVT